MPPTEKALLNALRKAATSIFKTDPQSLSVRKVRDTVIEELDLDEDFFLQDGWKSKSKEFIQNVAAELNSSDNEEEVAPSPAKPKTKPAPKKSESLTKGKKRAAPTKAAKARPAKRAKKAATPSDVEDDEDVSSEGSFNDDDEEDSVAESDFGGSGNEEDNPQKPSQPKGKQRRAANSKSKVAVDSDDEEEEEDEVSANESEVDSNSGTSDPDSKKKKKKKAVQVELPAKKPAQRKSTSKKQVPAKVKKGVGESGEDEESITKPKPPLHNKTAKIKSSLDEDEEPESINYESKKSKVSELTTEDTADKSTTKDAGDSDSEMSVVLDEPPPKKRQKGSKSESKSTSSSKPKATPKTQAELSPDEQLLKTLQTQLKKCGVKKIYQFTLSKEYGDDVKGKIKFLQKELRDVGMSGRFSEQRAREIKEQRELLDDLEAVKEGEKAWGVDEGGRRGRKLGVRGKRNTRESADSQEEKVGDDSDDVEESEEEVVKPRGNWARNDLAFLDDDEEDSD